MMRSILISIVLGAGLLASSLSASLPDGVAYASFPVSVREMRDFSGRWRSANGSWAVLKPVRDGVLKMHDESWAQGRWFRTRPFPVYLTRHDGQVYFSVAPEDFWGSVLRRPRLGSSYEGPAQDCFRVGAVIRLPGGGLRLPLLDHVAVRKGNSWLPDHVPQEDYCDFGFLFGLNAADQMRLIVSPEWVDPNPNVWIGDLQR